MIVNDVTKGMSSNWKEKEGLFEGLFMIVQEENGWGWGWVDHHMDLTGLMIVNEGAWVVDDWVRLV